MACRGIKDALNVKGNFLGLVTCKVIDACGLLKFGLVAVYWTTSLISDLGWA